MDIGASGLITEYDDSSWPDRAYRNSTEGSDGRLMTRIIGLRSGRLSSTFVWQLPVLM
jgi:hypothetical protein